MHADITAADAITETIIRAANNDRTDSDTDFEMTTVRPKTT
jgi:hypothetical protein